MKIFFILFFIVLPNYFLYSQSLIFKPLEVRKYSLHSSEEEIYIYNEDMSSTSVKRYSDGVKDSCKWNKDGKLLLKISKYGSVNSQRETYEYDSNSNLIYFFHEMYQNGIWVPNYKKEITYNNAGFELSTNEYHWRNAAWEIGSRRTNIYDDNNNRLSSHVESMGLDGSLIAANKVTKTYNTFNKYLTSLFEVYENGKWSEKSKEVCTYDNKGNHLTSNCYNSNGSNLELTYTLNKTYDQNSNLMMEIAYSFIGTDTISDKNTYLYNEFNKIVYHLRESMDHGNWTRIFEEIMEYDNNGNEISLTYKHFVNNISVNYSRLTRTFNPSNLKILERVDLWQNNNWENIDSTQYAYDSHNNGILMAKKYMLEYGDSVSLFYNGGVNEINGKGYSKIEAKYISFDLTKNNQNTKTYTLLQNYPNPFNPSTTISFELPEKSFVELKIYNMIGQEVKTLINEERSAGTHKVNFNASDLSSGVYFYKIKAKDYSSTRKMMLVK